jgi:uncharacterized protein YwqG
MPYLLIADPDASPDATVGGRPLADATTRWPCCSSCMGPMQFLAQFPLDSLEEANGHHDQTLLLFQCQNDPGMCDEWDPNAGGNAALLVQSSFRVPLQVPKGETLLSGESRLRRVSYQAVHAQNTDDDDYCEAVDAPASKVVGKLGGAPLWIQSDETPNCECGSPMAFVAQLECSGGGGINFGDCGAGYAFVCAPCRDRAKFLWQCS